MTITTEPSTQTATLTKPLAPRMLNHLAYVTPDAEATVKFYTEVMGMEFVLAVMDDKIPSTGEEFPYFHIFFKMRDGSTIAFFEAPDLPPRPPISHPAYETFDHLALHADSVEEVDNWKRHIEAQGLEVVGPVNHKIIYSIYFYDELNGLRLEITTPLTPDWNDQGDKAQAALDQWVAAKKNAPSQDGKAIAAEIRVDRGA
ncbi:MAG: glyoxalase/bleomycin resistance protein/dioxygenase [Aeromicrobium sp.]|nr:glyoxalase/bleomycin resistance protein/dioxygenase [Aeromicrobium sp.]